VSPAKTPLLSANIRPLEKPVEEAEGVTDEHESSRGAMARVMGVLAGEIVLARLLAGGKMVLDPEFCSISR